MLLQKTPVSRFVLGYCGAVTSAVGIAVRTSCLGLISVCCFLQLTAFCRL